MLLELTQLIELVDQLGERGRDGRRWRQPGQQQHLAGAEVNGHRCSAHQQTGIRWELARLLLIPAGNAPETAEILFVLRAGAVTTKPDGSATD